MRGCVWFDIFFNDFALLFYPLSCKSAFLGWSRSLRRPRWVRVRALLGWSIPEA